MGVDQERSSVQKRVALQGLAVRGVGGVGVCGAALRAYLADLPFQNQLPAVDAQVLHNCHRVWIKETASGSFPRWLVGGVMVCWVDGSFVRLLGC